LAKDTKLTFKRYEKKYLMSREQYEKLKQALEDYIEPDDFFRSTVCSIYYDSEDYSLIRHSIDKPVYKEKLRVRSYNVPGPEDKVFIELKRKFKGIVYKRRVEMNAAEAVEYLSGKRPAPVDSQIIREIDWFKSLKPLSPKAFIACDRSAYRAKEDSELRITFDENIRWRDTDLDLSAGSHGQLLTEGGQVLMEIKIPGTSPLWLAKLLSELKVFPTGFSKYGTCYKNNIIETYINDINGVIFSV